MSDSEKYRQPTNTESGDVSIQEPLNINSEDGTPFQLAQESTADQIKTFLDSLTDALSSTASDEVRTDLVSSSATLDVSGATVTVTDDGSFTTGISGQPLDVSASTVPVQEDTALDVSAATLDVSAATVTQTTDGTDAGPYQDRTTGTGTTVSVNPGRFGGEVSIVVDATGSGTLTVGVSNDGGSTVDEFTVSYDSSGTNETVPGYGYVEATADQNINAVSISAKGL